MPCRQLYNSPQINWDGRLLGCCAVFLDDFGVNVFEASSDLSAAMNSKNYQYALLMLQGKFFPLMRDLRIPCQSCGHYKKMLEKGRFLTIG
jgi:hypothetical protein